MQMLQTVRTQASNIGRSALVGMLVGLISAQAFASGLTETVNAPIQTKQATPTASMSVPAAPVSLPTASSSSNALDESMLPSAPEVAKVETPAALDPMVAEAAQSEQALASTPKTSKKGVQRPGMLIMGIAGLPLMAIGAYLYAYPTNNTSAKAKWGSIFFVPGAAMSGIGFPLAFAKKK